MPGVALVPASAATRLRVVPDIGLASPGVALLLLRLAVRIRVVVFVIAGVELAPLKFPVRLRMLESGTLICAQ